MWCSIRRIMQCAGLLVISTLLFTGITPNPLTVSGDSVLDVSTSVSSSYQALLNTQESDSRIKAAVAEDYGKLPLSFEANNGQVDDSVKFLSRGYGYTLYLTASEAVLSLRRISEAKDDLHALRDDPPIREIKQVDNEVIRLKNIGTNPDPLITGLEELPGKSNYFIGNDPAKWHTNVSNYERVKVQDVYPGIDLVYYGNQRQLEYDWVVAPGADPNAIMFAVEGKSNPRIDSSGNLLLDDNGDVRLNKPLIYQERDGNRIEIAGGYQVLDNHQVGIEIGNYDAALPLVVDPVLLYSTYLGESINDYPYDVAVDEAGNAYVTGATECTDYPTENPYQENITGKFDVFVTKLNASGNALVYSTYIGGYEIEEAYGIAVDASGSAYITGATESANYPTVNPYETPDGFVDAFVTKLNPAGDDLVYSTYLGGDSGDYGRAIAVDTTGSAYVTGITYSADYPTENPYQMNNGGNADSFITKFDAAGDTLVYSTYLGGTDSDYAYGIAIDTAGSAYVIGYTLSTDFPTEGPYQASNSGYSDAFVTKLDPAGHALVYSTYLGGNDDDYGLGIDVDSSNHAYLTGRAYSADFPLENPIQAVRRGSCDAFVTKLNPAGDSLIYSTYLGGSS